MKPSGFTIEWGKDGFKAGRYRKGLWARYFKLDLYLVRWLRPVPCGLPSGKAIKDAEWSKFPTDLVRKWKMKDTNTNPGEKVYDYKYDTRNPWKGKFLFVLDTKIRFPSVFLSLFGRFYIGIKTYNAEAELPTPYNPHVNSGGDITWMPDDARTGRYGCPSITMRSERTDG